MRFERSLFTESGLEIRNYVNEGVINVCPSAGVCVQRRTACNNIFYIDDGYVVEYRLTPSGGARCKTDASLRPEGVWQD